MRDPFSVKLPFPPSPICIGFLSCVPPAFPQRVASSRTFRKYKCVFLRSFFSLSCVCARDRNRGVAESEKETPRCISSIFKRHGPLLVAQALYIKCQGVCYSPSFSSSDARWPRAIEKRQPGINIVCTRGSVSESIPCRRAAFYLRAPYSLRSVRSLSALFQPPFYPPSSSPYSFPLFSLPPSPRLSCLCHVLPRPSWHLPRHPPRHLPWHPPWQPAPFFHPRPQVTAGGCSLTCRYLSKLTCVLPA